MQQTKTAMLRGDFAAATGNIEYGFTNDYMFRYILQKNEKVLLGLIAALLHLDPKEIKQLTIQNPINLAEDISAKDFIMDIKVLMNDDTLINLEMQVNNEHNWAERSLSYLCRTFDHLYSSKFSLSVIDLNQINLATDEDKAYGIDYWARLFKSKTWEEMIMLAKDNEYLDAAANSLFEANSDWMVRERCIARQLAERRERTLARDIQLLQEKNSSLEARIRELEAQLSKK